mmetsp:Transcript_33571/g.64790  ORF Transcript_33571/g.64790 Transcript_33571/m.64790 type:complete len:178 (+) Transcript_33571:241-774(+)|eukprot:4648986-Pleurochrysis_carterae.AAC.2
MTSCFCSCVGKGLIRVFGERAASGQSIRERAQNWIPVAEDDQYQDVSGELGQDEEEDELSETILNKFSPGTTVMLVRLPPKKLRYQGKRGCIRKPSASRRRFLVDVAMPGDALGTTIPGIETVSVKAAHLLCCDDDEDVGSELGSVVSCSSSAASALHRDEAQTLGFKLPPAHYDKL